MSSIPVVSREPLKTNLMVDRSRMNLNQQNFSEFANSINNGNNNAGVLSELFTEYKVTCGGHRIPGSWGMTRHESYVAALEIVNRDGPGAFKTRWYNGYELDW